jgi:hypothetical protein
VRPRGARLVTPRRLAGSPDPGRWRHGTMAPLRRLERAASRRTADRMGGALLSLRQPDVRVVRDRARRRSAARAQPPARRGLEHRGRGAGDQDRWRRRIVAPGCAAIVPGNRPHSARCSAGAARSWSTFPSAVKWAASGGPADTRSSRSARWFAGAAWGPIACPRHLPLVGDQRPLPQIVGALASEDEDRHAVVVVAAPEASRLDDPSASRRARWYASDERIARACGGAGPAGVRPRRSPAAGVSPWRRQSALRFGRYRAFCCFGRKPRC